MPAWLGVALTAAFALVGAHRARNRDVPGALMAAGMAIMSPGMAGLGPDFVSGGWWAAGFAALAVWPLLGRWRGRPVGEVCGGPVGHLLGGVAMVYLCALHGSPAPASPRGESSRLVAVTGHHHGGAHAVLIPGLPPGLSGALGMTVSLLGWALACCFLLRAVVALTRRDPGGSATASRPAVLGEASMAVGTVIMLVAMS